MRNLVFLFVIFQSILSAQTEALYLSQAVDAEENNRYHEAIDFMTKAIELDSSNGLYFEMRGRIIAGLNVGNIQLEYVEKQSFKKALRDFDRALELEPYNANFYYSRGLLHLNFRKYEAALKDFEQQLKYVEYADQKIAAMGGKAQVKFETNEIDAAFKILEDALKFDPESIMVLNNLALQYSTTKDFHAARVYLNRALAVNSEEMTTLANMGFVALESGKYQQALDILDFVIEKDSTLGFVYNNRGFVKYKLEQFDEALADINHAIELSPANAYAYKNRALVYLSTNQKEQACEDLLFAKSLNYTLDYDNEVLDLLMDNCLNVNEKKGRKD